MARSAERRLTLALTDDELVVVRAAIASGLEELQHTEAEPGDDQRRLQAMAEVVRRFAGHGPFRLGLERADARLLRDDVTMVIAMRGYFVGRPNAINALVSVRGKLDKLLKS